MTDPIQRLEGIAERLHGLSQSHDEAYFLALEIEEVTREMSEQARAIDRIAEGLTKDPWWANLG